MLIIQLLKYLSIVSQKICKCICKNIFIHSKINGEVISQILYKTFNNIDDSTTYYNKLEEFVINFDLQSIIDEINKNIKN